MPLNASDNISKTTQHERYPSVSQDTTLHRDGTISRPADCQRHRTAAAIILLIAGWGWHRLGSPSDPPAEQIVQSVSTQQGPLDTFLDGISDEEAAHIDCYKVDNIPQY